MKPYFFVFILSALFAVGCTKTEIRYVKGDTNSTALGGGETNPIALDGAGSGGGGYATQPTERMLSIATSILADGIAAAPPEMFKNFPAEFSQKELARIVRTTKFVKDMKSKRDGDSLRMDYDLEKRQLYATYDFYLKYNYSLSDFLNFSDPKFILKEVKKMQVDTLHELGHLLNIGTTQETDFTARLFAELFRLTLDRSLYICQNQEHTAYLNPLSKTAFITARSGNSGPQPDPNDEVDSFFDLVNDSDPQDHIPNFEDALFDLAWIYADTPIDGYGRWSSHLQTLQLEKSGLYMFTFQEISPLSYKETNISSQDDSEETIEEKISFDFSDDFKTAKLEVTRNTGDFNFSTKFSKCKKRTLPFNVSAFAKYPVKNLTDPNTDKIYKALQLPALSPISSVVGTHTANIRAGLRHC